MDYILGYIAAIDLTSFTLPTAVYIVWAGMLLATLLIVVPLVIILLQRTLSSALYIRRYFAEMLAAGAGIAENTSSIPALQDTIAVAGSMLETAGKLDEHSGTIAEVLATRAKGD